LNTRSAGRELAFLALNQLSQNTNPDPDQLLLAATRTLRNYAKDQVKRVRRHLATLGEAFFNDNLTEKENPQKLDLEKIHKNIIKLETCTFQILESLELPELLNQSREAYSFAGEIVLFVRKNKSRIDELIISALQIRKDKEKHWNFDRILSVEKNIFKIATAEFLMKPDCPPAIIIDEALKLAEKYGADESAKFVNGVLSDLSNNVLANNNPT
jgi:transcription antitermination protein NusB